MSDQLDLVDLGVPGTLTCHIDSVHACKVAATLDEHPLGDGDRLPALWHWAYFTPTAGTAELGVDGHPLLASPLLAPYSRRMWGASRIEWTRDLIVGDDVTRTSSIVRVKKTDGRSGPLLLVTLEHLIRRDGSIALREEQSLVYRTSGPAQARPIDKPLGPCDGWSQDWIPTPPQLFRFSAITFNAHRIHYDDAHTRRVEGYPALVVQGPLSAMLLAGFVERQLERRLAWFEFRAAKPLFVDQPARLSLEPMLKSSVEGLARVVRNDGEVAISASFGVRDR